MGNGGCNTSDREGVKKKKCMSMVMTLSAMFSIGNTAPSQESIPTVM